MQAVTKMKGFPTTLVSASLAQARKVRLPLSAKVLPSLLCFVPRRAKLSEDAGEEGMAKPERTELRHDIGDDRKVHHIVQLFNTPLRDIASKVSVNAKS